MLLSQQLSGLTAIKCFKRHQFFQNFQKKQATKRFSGINFNYNYRFHLFLVIRIYFDKNLIYPEVPSARMWSNKNHPYNFPI